jgi:glycosyltransferase involved in cell wall biosynthesis
LNQEKMTEKPLRIILFTVGFGGGGAEQVFVSLANHWKALGHDVRFWVINDKGPMKERLEGDVPVRVLGRGTRGLQRFSATRKLRRMLWEDRPDIVFSTLTYANCLMGVAAKRKPPETRLVLREANAFANLRKTGWLRYQMTLWMMRRSYSNADAVIANAASMAEELKTHLFAGVGSRLTVIPNPVDVDAGATNDQAVQTPTPGRRRIVACGRLIPQKGFSDLLESVARLPSGLDWELVILGEGPLREKLEEQCIELGINSRVNMVGFVSDVRSWLRGAEVFVLSSHWEGFPNALVEAMACGITSVATDCPGASATILGPWAETHTVPVSTPERLAELIGRSLENPVDPGLLKAHIAENFAFPIVAERYLSLAKSSRSKEKT